jgi:hypothetical protein
MRFTTVRKLLVPSLLVCAAGCGAVEDDPADDAGTKADAGIEPDATPGAPPVNTASAGTVAEGQSISLMGLLVTTDADTQATELVYTVQSLPKSGVLKLDGQALAVGETFTQAAVNEGRVTYIHDGNEGTADGFGWSVSDGATVVPASGETPFAVTVTPVNDAPVIVNNPLTSVAEGATFVLTMDKLSASDAEGQALTFTLLSAPTRGALQKRPAGGAFANLGVGGTFTPQDIGDGNVQFVDSGIDDAALQVGQNTAAAFSWKVADSDGGVNPAAGANVTSFTITPVDDAPVLTWKYQSCYVPNVAASANPLATLTDADTPIGQYSICVVSITGGTSITYPNGTSTLGVTITVVPSLTNSGAALGANSCVAANALAGLKFQSSANQTGGTVTWQLRRNNMAVGPNGTVAFVPAATCP